MALNIGFVSTRFSGTDGVTLEAGKWAQVLRQNGCTCFWFGGELDEGMDEHLLVPEAHFKHHRNVWINERVFGHKRRSQTVTQTIHQMRSLLKEALHGFIQTNRIDLLICENVLTIPMQIPLGLALTETIAETQLPTIAHHHDFFWERDRYAVNAVGDYLGMAFPPKLPNIRHVVINSEAQEQLALRRGVPSSYIPNVIDFEIAHAPNDQHTRSFRESIGLTPDDIMILQPTRIIQRKGIEFAIELVKALNDSRCKLVISHEAGDEGFEYAQWIQEYACEHKVDLRVVHTPITNPWRQGERCHGHTLWDVYPYADFITYPSLYEGFGNGFLEAIYFKKPILINRYATFIRDIEPLGFKLAVMDGYLSKETIQEVTALLCSSSKKREAMVSHNYSVAAQHFSFATLRRELHLILTAFFGDTFPKLEPSKHASREATHSELDSQSIAFTHYDLDNCPLPSSVTG